MVESSDMNTPPRVQAGAWLWLLVACALSTSCEAGTLGCLTPLCADGGLSADGGPSGDGATLEDATLEDATLEDATSDGATSDDATSDGALVDATPDTCARDTHVQGGLCVPCPMGSINEAGDTTTDGDTSCDPVLCDANMHVAAHTCTPCGAGSTNVTGDSAVGGDTSCDPVLCGANMHVAAHACVPCSAGFTNAAGDAATGADTSCDCVAIPTSVLNQFTWYFKAESSPQTLSIGLSSDIPNIKRCTLTIDGESHLSQYDGFDGWRYANWRFDQTGQNYCGGGECELLLECPRGITIRYTIWRTASITTRDADGTVGGTCSLSGSCSDELLTHEVMCDPS